MLFSETVQDINRLEKEQTPQSREGKRGNKTQKKTTHEKMSCSGYLWQPPELHKTQKAKGLSLFPLSFSQLPFESAPITVPTNTSFSVPDTSKSDG